jgi:Na+-transporting NADH:ubiquinone oxidoreductase subunit D
MAEPQAKLNARDALARQLWAENPIFRQVLGICSTLAVTNLLENTVLMCLGLIWATAMSALTVSLLRHYTPQRIRIMVQVLIISVYVIMVDIAFRAYFPEVHGRIAAYVGLIITNCIILGRLEAFASKNPPWPAFCDGLGSGLGYSLLLLAIATVREILGFGSVFGYPLPEAIRPHQWTIMVTPPGAFFVLALAVWLARGWDLRRQKAAERKEGRE